MPRILAGRNRGRRGGIDPLDAALFQIGLSHATTQKRLLTALICEQEKNKSLQDAALWSLPTTTLSALTGTTIGGLLYPHESTPPLVGCISGSFVGVILSLLLILSCRKKP